MRKLVLGDPIVHLGTESFLADAGLVIEDDRIVEIGPREELENGSYDEVIGGSDYFVMPGFINCHFHSECSLGQGVYELIFERANIWMHGSFLRITEEDLYQSILNHLILLIRGGQTAAVDMYYGQPTLPHFGTEVALRAYEDAGLRVAFGMVTRDQNTYVHQDNETFLGCLPAHLADEVKRSPIGYAWPSEHVFSSYREVVSRWDGRDGRIRVILAPDWTPACSDELYRHNRALADEFATGLTTHVLETRSEMQFNFEHYGKCAMRRLDELGVLGEDACLAHFVWATDEDIDLLVSTGSVASNDAGSNLRLSSGISRMRDILDRDGKVGFGTDGISFADREDFFDEIRLAALLQRRPMELASGRVSSEKILRSAATSGARAVRAESQLGSLTPGKEADLLVLRRERVFGPPQRYAKSNPLDVILDRADSTDLDTVIVRGKTLMQNGALTVIDERKARQAFAEAAANRLWQFASDEERRLALSLPADIEPYVLDFYERWVAEPVAPGYQYNTTTGPLQGSGAEEARTTATA
jgi:5-methylthioadenosine/S-adenosylhomocysteine deaminase